MDVETAIRTRRTHKAFTAEPLTREQLAELLDLAVWAPNHHLTAPWRFRVIVLLAAHGRGLAGYWRTPDLLRDPEGRAAVGLPDEERFVALLHLGHPRQERPAPPRPPVTETTVFLD